MASIHLQGTLLDTLGEVDVGAILTWTHLTNTGEVIATTKRNLIIPPNGFYSIDVEFGQIRIDYTTRFTERFIATVIVNGDSTATTIPELLNAAVPVTDPVILQMQDILEDTENAKDLAEAAAAQITTTELIGSTAIFAPDQVVTTSGFLTDGDGGSGQWMQNGVTAQPANQTPAQLGNAKLNDGNGNQWALVSLIGTVSESALSSLTASIGSESIVDTHKVSEVSTILTSTSIIINGTDATLSHTTSNAGEAAVTPYFTATDKISVSDTFFDGNVLIGGRRLAVARNDGVKEIELKNIRLDFKSVVSPVDGLTNDEPGNVVFRLDTSANDIERITIDNSHFTNAFWGYLKGNSVESHESNISITNSTFEEFSSVALLFNSPNPNSSIENISVLNVNLGANNSRASLGLGTGFGHRGTFAGNIHYAKLIACHAYGDGDELFRAEEQASHVIMALNTGKLNGRDGIEIIPNFASGQVEVPSKFLVTGNILQWHTGGNTTQAGYGIGLFTYTGNIGESDSIHESICSNNIIADFDTGMELHSGLHRNIVESNVIKDCFDGLILHSPSLGTRGNMITDASRSVKFVQGGMLGKVSFRASDPEPFTVDINTTGAIVGTLTEWDWETGLFDSPVGTTVYEIINAGIDFHGTIKLSLSRGDSHTVVMGLVEWDGATLTFTENFRSSNGAPAISGTPLSVANGNLAISVFNSVDIKENTRLQIDFNGVHVIQ